MVEIEAIDYIQDTEFKEALYHAKITYERAFVHDFYSAFLSKRITRSIIFSIIIIFCGIILINFDYEAFTLVGLLFMIFGTLSFVRTRVVRSKTLQLHRDLFEKEPNKTFSYSFYKDYIEIVMKSDVSSAQLKILYQDITQLVENEKYIFFLYLNRYYAIDKSQSEADSLMQFLRSKPIGSHSLIKTKDGEEVGKVSTEKNIRRINSFTKLTFILSIFALPMGLMILAFKNKTIDSMGSSVPLDQLDGLLFVLPIPLSAIVMGVIAKKRGLKYKKNFVLGIIMAVLILIYSSFPLIFGGQYSHDYGYLEEIEEVLDFDFPETGRINIQDWTQGTQSTSDGSRIYYTSHVKFTDEEEISDFNRTIKTDERFTNTIETAHKGMLNAYASMYQPNYDYFMIYNETLGLTNELPKQSRNYDFIFIAYNESKASMLIVEYSLQIIIS